MAVPPLQHSPLLLTGLRTPNNLNWLSVRKHFYGCPLDTTSLSSVHHGLCPMRQDFAGDAIVPHSISSAPNLEDGTGSDKVFGCNAHFQTPLLETTRVAVARSLTFPLSTPQARSLSQSLSRRDVICPSNCYCGVGNARSAVILALNLL